MKNITLTESQLAEIIKDSFERVMQEGIDISKDCEDKRIVSVC